MIGDKIRAAREACGMNQTQLAEKVHVSQQAISQWEHDMSQLDLMSLKRLGEALNIPWLSFLCDTDSNEEVRMHQIKVDMSEKGLKQIEQFRNKFSSDELTRMYFQVEIKDGGAVIFTYRLTDMEYNLFQMLRQLNPSYPIRRFIRDIVAPHAMHRRRNSE